MLILHHPVKPFGIFIEAVVAQLMFYPQKNENECGESYGKDKDANVIMAQVAKSLSDEDIQSLATYIEGLHGAAAATAKAE